MYVCLCPYMHSSMKDVHTDCTYLHLIKFCVLHPFIQSTSYLYRCTYYIIFSLYTSADTFFVCTPAQCLPTELHQPPLLLMDQKPADFASRIVVWQGSIDTLKGVCG